MRIFDLYKILKETGLTIYPNINSPVMLPYITYFTSNSKGYGSDFANEIRKTEYVIEFYSQEKDLNNQRKIEKIFNKYGIDYECTEVYIKGESMYMVAYYIEIVEKA